MSATPSLEHVYGCARRAHPDVLLSYREFAADLAPECAPHVAEDYYLARACEVGAEGVWERLRCCYAGLLRMVLVARGAARAEAEQVLEDTWCELAQPPACGGHRTRLGTYDGRGALHAWLATIASRRLADRWRRREKTAASAALEQAVTRRSADPLEHTADRELSDLLGAALEGAWGALTHLERRALVLKYRHRVPQTEIARVLGVGTPRVTRILQRARGRLHDLMEARFGSHVPEMEAADCRARLVAALEAILARGAADEALPDPPVSGDAGPAA